MRYRYGMSSNGFPEKDAGKDAFIASLRAFRQDCGAPSYRRLARISQDLRTLYPAPGEVPCELAEMSLTAISETLAGKRKGLPALDWVASFVLSCQRWAFQERLIGHDPGTRVLPAWARLHQAHAAASTWLTRTGRLSSAQREFIASHGPYGPILLALAQYGDPDAFYRIALLLATDPSRGDDALALLLAAAAAGSAPALDLLDDNPARLHPFEAARHAHDLARAAQSNGSPGEALAFYRAAARGGIPDAAIEHAQAVLTCHGDQEAATWLAALTTQPSTGRHRATQI